MGLMLRFLRWLWSWRSFRRSRWIGVVVDDVPDSLRKYCVYLIGEDGTLWQVAMLCPCGCSAVIQLCVLPDSRPSWSVSRHADGTVSLSPSVWRTTGCRSHFFLRRGRIDWCG
jgi:Family of unknown function (DUF6527)